MSRSRRKTPIMGIASGSEKQDKRWANRALRRVVKAELNEDTEDCTELREVSDVWCFKKDGKRWNADIDPKDTRK